MAEHREGIPRRRLLQGAVAAAGTLPLLRTGLLSASADALTADAALTLAEARRDELIKVLQRMIAVRSLSGETGESAQAVVADYLARLPYRVESVAHRPSGYTEHPEFMPPSPAGDGPFVNLIARPTAAPPRFALFSHIDSHSIDEGWETDPFTPVIRDGRLYGLGSSDAKGGVAAMLIAAAILAEQGVAPLVLSLHGKGGGSRGSLPVFQALQDSGTRLDAVLYTHPAETGRGLDDIKHQVRGVLDFQLAVAGWSGTPLEIGSPDSALWREGGDALAHCWRLIEQLRATVLADVDVNVGWMEAGERPGGVPRSARAQLRLLFDGEHQWRTLLAAMQAALVDFAAPEGPNGERFTVELIPLGMRCNPGAVDWDAPVTQALRASIADVTGKAPLSYPNHYAGDIRYPLRLLGAPAFGIGSLGGNFYGPNEWVDLDDLVRLVAVTVHTVVRWQAVLPTA